MVYFDFSTQAPRFFLFFSVLILASVGLSALLIFTPLKKKLTDFFRIFEPSEKIDILALLLTAGTFILFFMIGYEGPTDDYTPHTNFALAFDWSKPIKSLVALSHPLWHLVTNLMNKVFFLSPTVSCAVSTGFFCTLIFVFTRKILIYFSGSQKFTFICDIAAALTMFMQPIYIPQFNREQLVGQGSPFVLHNPTNLALQPFAIISEFLFLRILKQRDEAPYTSQGYDIARLSLFAFLSSLAKPAFLQVFLPAAFIYLAVELVKTHFETFRFCCKLALGLLPSVLHMLLVLLTEFFSGSPESDSGIAIGFFDVWRATSPFIPLSILLATGYCMLYIILKNKQMTNKREIYIVLLCLICGILEFGFIMETGHRKMHGNFSWGYNTALSVMYVFVTGELLHNTLSKFIDSRPRSPREALTAIGIPEAVAYTVFLVQLAQGIAYFLKFV